MKIASVLGVSLLIALLATLISAGVGALVAPGVFYKISGGLFGVQLGTNTIWYLKAVFISHFFTALLSSLLVAFVLSKKSKRST
ncbi:hypothetical protein IB234_23375 [Pseudomonas sp. PDM16]|uniref:hypothetical protein n=1 Tax=Pseudomonas sp. PDM16 TaxID=2769292 RepID=UPI00177C8716|nr:hypothetical protein [Pseudomonas sp. PDM16]MBD9417517.1 hypothetical protein [Pseudomonas sp. PDM16]